MEQQLAGPGVQHGGDAQAAAEMLGVVAEVDQSAGCRLAKEAEEVEAVFPNERAQLGGQGENDVEVVDGQDVLDPPLDPAGLGQALALGAVPIAARVVGRPAEVTVAGRAHIEVSAQSLGPAELDIAHDLALVSGQNVALSVRLPMRSEDVGDLNRGTRRPLYGRRRPGLDVPVLAEPEEG